MGKSVGKFPMSFLPRSTKPEGGDPGWGETQSHAHQVYILERRYRVDLHSTATSEGRYLVPTASPMQVWSRRLRSRAVSGERCSQVAAELWGPTSPHRASQQMTKHSECHNQSIGPGFGREVPLNTADRAFRRLLQLPGRTVVGKEVAEKCGKARLWVCVEGRHQVDGVKVGTW